MTYSRPGRNVDWAAEECRALAWPLRVGCYHGLGNALIGVLPSSAEYAPEYADQPALERPACF